MKLPLLLDYYLSVPNNGCEINSAGLLREFNTQNDIPEEFKKYVAEMYDYVSKTD